MPATEQQAEVAIRELKRAIEAAENSNQAGEDAVVLAASTFRMTAFERRISEIASTYCRDAHGEDATGERNAMSNFLRSVIDVLGTAVAERGGDREYLPDDDAVEKFTMAAWQDVIDEEDQRRERSAA